MTKRRYLRPCIEKALIIITMILVMFFGMLEDFELSAFPYILLALAILVFNIYILNKYGRGVWLDKEEEAELKEE